MAEDRAGRAARQPRDLPRPHLRRRRRPGAPPQRPGGGDGAGPPPRRRRRGAGARRRHRAPRPPVPLRHRRLAAGDPRRQARRRRVPRDLRRPRGARRRSATAPAGSSRSAGSGPPPASPTRRSGSSSPPASRPRSRGWKPDEILSVERIPFAGGGRQGRPRGDPRREVGRRAAAGGAGLRGRSPDPGSPARKPAISPPGAVSLGVFRFFQDENTNAIRHPAGASPVRGRFDGDARAGRGGGAAQGPRLRRVRLRHGAVEGNPGPRISHAARRSRA